MGTPARVVAGLVFVLFVGVLALRPLVANPAIPGVLRGGPGLPELLALLPLVLVTAAIIALRVRSLADGDRERQYGTDSSGEETFWDARTADDDERGSREEGSTGVPAILSGQGGTRDREADIEERPPDARLDEHLEHLQAQFDDDQSVRQDLKTLAELAEQTEGDRTVPARCPRDHCDAVWTGRTVLGVASGRYELLDDGTRVQCLDCEGIHTLE